MGPGVWLKLAGAALLVYAGVVALLWSMQSRLIHLPHVPGRELVATPAELGLAYQDVAIDTTDGERLHGWFVPADSPGGEPALGTLLFLHGNAGNIAQRLDTLALFHRLGLTVLMVDYRGYGRSTGTPGARGLARDAEAALGYLIRERGVAPARIAVHGRSLGAAVAARLARDHTVGALILESAFTSLADIAARQYPFVPVRWLLRHRYDTLGSLEKARAPVLVIHSRDDEIVPFEHGQRLYAAASEPKAFLALEGPHAGAHRLCEHRYAEALRGFLERHLGPGGASTE